MANSNGWGDGSVNNNIGWGQGANNAIGWGSSHSTSWAGATDISGAPTTDPDAQAFITAASITDPTQQSAINQLVLDLKGYSIWSKMKALYPFVGGTAAQHKWNLKDPRDLDAAFRLQFFGGVTHSSTGVQGNGTNGYADTKLTPLSTLSLNSTHISYYSRTDTGTFNCVEMGVNDGANTGRLFIAPKYSGSSYRAVNSAQAGAGAGTSMQGLFIASRVNSTAMKLYKNSSVLFNDTVSSGSLFNFPIFLFCYNSAGFAQFYSDRQCAFASIGDGLTDTEAANFYTAVQAFQTALNRNV